MDRRNTTLFAFVAALLGALAVATPVVVRTAVPPGELPGAASRSNAASHRLPDSWHGPFNVLSDFLDVSPVDAYSPWPAGDDPRKLYKANFLIVLVPEPFAPPFRYKFDTYVDAVQRAAETADLILDRFDLPWSPGAGDSQGFKLGEEIGIGLEPNLGGSSAPFASLKPKVQTQNEPGVLLFRSARAKDAKLLLVFLVGETPTWGVRKEALTKSLNWIAWLSDFWNSESFPQRFPRRGTDGPLRIRIVGPSFSGSAESLAFALEDWLSSQKVSLKPDIKIVSGTATSISRDGPIGKWFSATVISDTERERN